MRAVACALLAILLVLFPQSNRLAQAEPSQTQVQSRSQARPNWAWPVARVGIIRDYVAPATEYGAGHRGVDLVADVGDPVLSMADGVVEFAGLVATVPTIVVTHEGGWRSSYQPASAVIAVGNVVSAGQPIGIVSAPTPHCSCLHLGLRYRGAYLSPRAVLGHIPRAVLLPW